MYILGISAFYHDSAAALLHNGKIVSAVQEERFTRIKNDFSFPMNAIHWLLQANDLSMADMSYVIFYEKPFKKFERILESCIRFAPKGFSLFRDAVPVWLKEKLFQKQTLKNLLMSLPGGEKWNQTLLFSDHHLSHSAAAFYASPFQEAAILTIDGVGEWGTTTISVGDGGKIKLIKEIHFPHSIGLLYSTMTAFLGFKVNSGEYKVMGLAPYGDPVYADLIKQHLIDIKYDGSFRLNMKYFRFATEMKMFGRELEKLFNVNARLPEAPIVQAHMDMAASIQSVTNDVFLTMAHHVKHITRQENLCLGGGVALNCAATGRLLHQGIFKNIWIQPSAGDAGSALGAALACRHIHLNRPRKRGKNYMPFLGPSFSQDEINTQLDSCNATYSMMPQHALLHRVTEDLVKGSVVAWMQGASEFSPRALGNRSILADPRIHDMKSTLNQKIKFRESFRPFAPVILEEDAPDWFEIDRPSPFMNFVFKARPEKMAMIPSVIHVDGTARVQTASRETNPLLHQLLSTFKEKTGCPILVNTSLNRRGEPMVLTPEDAFCCFMKTGIDRLVIGNAYLVKHQQDSNHPLMGGNPVQSEKKG